MRLETGELRIKQNHKLQVPNYKQREQKYKSKKCRKRKNKIDQKS